MNNNEEYNHLLPSDDDSLSVIKQLLSNEDDDEYSSSDIESSSSSLHMRQLTDEELRLSVLVATAVQQSIDNYGGCDATIFVPHRNDFPFKPDTDDIINLTLDLIELGEIDEFISNPDILKYSRYGVSCGNSSSYCISCNRHYEVINFDSSNDKLNKHWEHVRSILKYWERDFSK